MSTWDYLFCQIALFPTKEIKLHLFQSYQPPSSYHTTIQPTCSPTTIPHHHVAHMLTHNHPSAPCSPWLIHSSHFTTHLTTALIAIPRPLQPLHTLHIQPTCNPHAPHGSHGHHMLTHSSPMAAMATTCSPTTHPQPTTHTSSQLTHAACTSLGPSHSPHATHKAPTRPSYLPHTAPLII